MTRAEITGQINMDAPWRGSSEPVLIERHPPSLPTTTLRNWNRFCDAVDEALVPLKRTKALAKISSSLLYGACLLFVVLTVILPRFTDFGYEQPMYSQFMILPFACLYLYVYRCQVGPKLAAVMERVKGVCAAHCADGVLYRLESEHWGGCNKRNNSPHLRRWYVEVDIVPGTAIVDDVERQNPTADVNAFEYSPQPVTAAAPSSLADMLK